MFRLLVFDWDGTLMDSEARIVASATAAIADLSRPLLPPQRISNIIGLGLREAVEDLFPGESDAFYGRFVERYRHHFLVADKTPMPLFRGAEQTLVRLCQEGYLLAVATGKSRRGLQRALHETGLGELFVATRCADESLSKPHPQMLLELMDEVGVEPAQTLMVGDSEYDLEMARNARVSGMAVAYGVHGCDRLLQFAPLGCLDDIADLAPWLEARRSR